MREKQVVLFDLDGTIVDSMAGITGASVIGASSGGSGSSQAK